MEDDLAVISHTSDGVQSLDGGRSQGHIIATLKADEESHNYE